MEALPGTAVLEPKGIVAVRNPNLEMATSTRESIPVTVLFVVRKNYWNVLICFLIITDDKDGTFIKFLLPNYVSGMIIGSAGSTVSKLMEATNTTIKFSPGRELYPGTNDRVCLVTGSIPDICEALRQIFATMMQSTHAKSDELMESMKHFKMIVSNISSGMVIGKSGHTIKTIQMDCGVKMQITNKDENSLPERTLTIDGEIDAILKAIEKILSHTMDDPDANKWKRLMTYSSYSASPIASALSSSSSSHALGSKGGGGIIPGLPSSYHHSDPTAAFMAFFAQNAQNQQNPYAAAYAQSSQGAGSGGSGGGGGGGASFNQALLSYAYAQSLVNNSSSYYGQFQPVMVDGVNMTVPGATISTYEIAVPEMMVSALTGSDNKLLTDLMQTTGARVQLSGKGEFIPGTYNRKLTVTGPILSVQSAHMIVLQKLLKEQDSYQKHGML